MKSLVRISTGRWIGLGSALLVCGGLPLGLAGCNGDRNENLPITDTKGGADSPTHTGATAPGVNRSPGAATTAAAPFDASDLGMPLYPAARLAHDLSESGGSAGNSDGIVTAVYETSDTPDQVLAFYEKALAHVNLQGKVIAPDRSEYEQDGKKVVMLSAPREGKGALRTVNVRADESRTYIEMMNLQPLKSGRPLFRPSSGPMPSGNGPLDQPEPEPAAPAGGAQIPQ